jgi:hypothetical protein
MSEHFAGPLRVHEDNPRYFADDSGKAILLAGSHTWAVMQDMWLETQEPHRTGRRLAPIPTPRRTGVPGGLLVASC